MQLALFPGKEPLVPIKEEAQWALQLVCMSPSRETHTHTHTHTFLWLQMALYVFLHMYSSTVLLYSSVPLSFTFTKNTCGKTVAEHCPTTNVSSESTHRNLATSQKAGEQFNERRHTAKPKILTCLPLFTYKIEMKYNYILSVSILLV